MHIPIKYLLKKILIRYPRLYRVMVNLRGSGDKPEILAYFACVRSGDVVVEVGANRGRFTSLFSHIVGPTGRVFAFEPVPPTFLLLSQNIKKETRYSNTTLVNAAASDQSGTVSIHVPGDDDGQASLTAHSVASWESGKIVSYDCQTIRLDDYLKDHSKLDFLKIDVEGAELLVLRGASETLRRLKPVIHLEVWSSWSVDFGYEPKDVVALLELLGYTDFYRCDGSMERIDDPQSYFATGDFSVSVNLLCSSSPIPAF